MHACIFDLDDNTFIATFSGLKRALTHDERTRNKTNPFQPEPTTSSLSCRIHRNRNKMNQLPVRLLRITSDKNKLVRRLELLRKDRAHRRREGYVLVQGIKTIEELSRKGTRIRTLGVTITEDGPGSDTGPSLRIDKILHSDHHDNDNNIHSNGNRSSNTMVVRGSSLEVVKEWIRAEKQKQRQKDDSPQLSSSSLKLVKDKFGADQYVATTRKLTSRILGTESKTSEHEVWAEVQIPDYNTLFATSNEQHKGKESPHQKQQQQQQPPPNHDRPHHHSRPIQRMLVLDAITDPGNMGLMIRAGKALSWDASWLTRGTVDPFNDKVVRASRALCLEWPIRINGPWLDLEKFLKEREMVLLVADMVPPQISSQSPPFHMSSLVWWNWPASLPRTHLPPRIALLLSSEHHGVGHLHRQQQLFEDSQLLQDSTQEDLNAKQRLLRQAIRVSIPMDPAVESMNVATAATTMMWELNRLIPPPSTPSSSLSQQPNLQIFDLPKKKKEI